MTAYFDAYAEKIGALRDLDRRGDGKAQEKAKWVLERLHYEVCLCMSEPGFPSDLRDAVHLVFAKHDPEPLPGVMRDFDDNEAWFSAVLQVGSDLHSLFHELARRGIEGFSDSPLTPSHGRVNREESYRIELCRRTPGYEALVAQYEKVSDDDQFILTAEGLQSLVRDEGLQDDQR